MGLKERGRWVGKSVRAEGRYGLERGGGEMGKREPEMEEDMGWKERERWGRESQR